MPFSVTGKEMIPDGTWNYDNKPIQGAKKEALYRVPIFVNAEAAASSRTLATDESKDPQRQSAAISGQIRHDAAAKFLAAESLAAEKYQQSGEVDRKPPGELDHIKQCPGPAGGGDRPVHVRSLFHFRRF